MTRPYTRPKKHYRKKTHSKRHKHRTCFYHLCDKKNERLYRCKYCAEYFCHEHLYAKIPQLAPFRSTDIERHIEWEKKGGHPCLVYLEYVNKKEKEASPAIVRELKPELEPVSDSEPEKESIIKPEIILKPEPEFNIDEKEDERKSVSDIKCYNCGKDLLYSIKEYFFDEDIEKQIILCPECWSNRHKKSIKIDTSKEPLETPKKIINYQYVYGFIGFILIIILLSAILSFYNTTVELIDSYSELSSLNNEIQDVGDELDSLNNQINSANNQLLNVNSEIILLQSGKRYELHDPTYSEVLSFLSGDKTDSNNYGSGYTCVFFSMDVNNNAEQQGIRCAYVELDFVDSGHAIVAFETTDEGFVYFEPQHDVRANIQIGHRYYSCLAQLPGYMFWDVPGYDDTIESIVRFW